MLDVQSWNDIVDRLVVHADRKMRRLVWRNLRGGDPPGGEEPTDIVQSVIEKVITGTRKWNPAKHPDLLSYLQDQVDSEISNLVRSFENRYHISEASLSDTKILEGTDETTPETELIAEGDKIQSDDFVLGFLEFLNKEPELQSIVEAILDGNKKRAEIADAIKITVSELDVQKKRLKRRLSDYLDQRKRIVDDIKGGTNNAKQ
jgi:DNA-directed RNA polymerase specialized sigma24 family protein